jgi:hypothetical protein
LRGASHSTTGQFLPSSSSSPIGRKAFFMRTPFPYIPSQKKIIHKVHPKSQRHSRLCTPPLTQWSPPEKPRRAPRCPA